MFRAVENFFAFVCITQMNFIGRDKIPWQGMANATLSLINLTKALGTLLGYWAAEVDAERRSGGVEGCGKCGCFCCGILCCLCPAILIMSLIYYSFFKTDNEIPLIQYGFVERLSLGFIA